MRSALSHIRREVAAIVREEIAAFLGLEHPRRRCLACGRAFAPAHRWHFLCSAPCRIEWGRGRIRPRKEK